nr:hypothetical protein [uncultured Desulfobulbus sp.]
MIKQIKVVLATIVALIAIDIFVLMILPYAPHKLVIFFEYGRSVPGKIAHWQKENPPLPGNLLHVAWRPESLARSAKEFLLEDPTGGPVIRNYGMSFTNQLLEAAKEFNPDLQVDGHTGPGAPPNFVYSQFLDDRQNRRSGDIVLVGILSSSVAGLASFSNRTWVFEQPAPFTYPIFRPNDSTNGLRRIDPVIQSLNDMSAPSKIMDFTRQMRSEDGLWTSLAFDLTSLDASPFFRLLRRAMAKSAIAEREDRITAHPMDGIMPWSQVLQRMVHEIQRICRSDGQIPLIVLIQAHDVRSAHLLPALKPILKAENIPYLATEEVANPQDASAYLGDGHFTHTVNKILAEKLLAIPELGLSSF